MDCKACGSEMLEFRVSIPLGRNPWRCHNCQQDQREPVDPRPLMQLAADPDPPEYKWSKEQWDRWYESEELEREARKKRKF